MGDPYHTPNLVCGSKCRSIIGLILHNCTRPGFQNLSLKQVARIFIDVDYPEDLNPEKASKPFEFLATAVKAVLAGQSVAPLPPSPPVDLVSSNAFTVSEYTEHNRMKAPDEILPACPGPIQNFAALCPSLATQRTEATHLLTFPVDPTFRLSSHLPTLYTP